MGSRSGFNEFFRPFLTKTYHLWISPSGEKITAFRPLRIGKKRTLIFSKNLQEILRS